MDSRFKQPVYVEHFSLRDIYDSLQHFSGDGYPNVENGISDFEDNAITVRWTELQKFIYAQQLLK